MDWKAYYAKECRSPGARAAIEAWLISDVALVEAIGHRGIPSFPHTALRYAGPLQARVARAVLEARDIERVLALGVLHGSGVEPYRRALDSTESAARRADGFSIVRGGFVDRQAETRTPFGPVEAWHVEPCDVVRIDAYRLLAAEFSLDTFHAVLRATADALGRRPPSVASVFVGMTRDPITGSFDTAEEFGDWLKVCVDRSTAVVATGDLVHYGTGYGGAWVCGNPTSAEALERELGPRVERMLRAAFVERDWQTAYQLSREPLGNDQRELLAVLSAYLGPNAVPSVLTFGLSDYAEILGVAPPCVVASALAIYGRAM